ncbi:MAG: DUF3240 family protein [Alphaproteobacteria bacterium]|nr:DUF3240 family protein [Alphaproteobacteria bacterium]
MTEPVCLMMIVPRPLRDDLLDYVSEQSDLISGFTAFDAAGHGSTIRLRTAAEQVKGHADQTMVQIVLPRGDADQMIGRMQAKFAGTRLVYWILPVLQFGAIE